MALSDVTRDDVLAAIAEFDRLGRESFLRAYGFGEAKTYYLDYNGRLYDSKAIMGYAHGVRTGTCFGSEGLRGGHAAVADKLRRLGFATKAHRNPPWTRDEVVLACDLVRDNGWKALDAEDPRVADLSELLQLYPVHPVELRGLDFRNCNSVGRKTADIATRHPDYRGKPTNGGRYDKAVLLDFLADPEQMHEEADAIRRSISEAIEELPDVPDLDLDRLGAVEGQILQRLHLRRERDAKLRRKVIEVYKRRHTTVACEACGFDFQATYGDRGADYIECHHRAPLHVTGPTRTPKDLVLLCSNCHRMIHRTSPWLTFDELVDLIAKHRALPSSGLVQQWRAQTTTPAPEPPATALNSLA